MKRQHIFDFIVIISVLIFGFWYRVTLSHFADSQLLWDMTAYHEAAEKMLHGVLASDCCNRNLGYSAFLALVYRIVGSTDLFPVQVAQSLLDCVSACLIFIVSKRIFKQKSIAYISFICYILNPFTASYAGLRLTEVVTITTLCAIAYILSKDSYISDAKNWFFLGVFLGLLIFIKVSFYLFSLGFLFLFCVLFYKGRKRLIFLVISMSGIFLASSYSLMSNMYYFRSVSITPLHAHPWLQFYGNFYMPRHAELSVQNKEFGYYPQEYTDAVIEFGDAPVEQKEAVDAKYKTLFFQKLRSEWPLFLNHVVRNVIWMWDLHHLYYYDDPFYPYDIFVLRIWTITIILSFLMGICFFIVRHGFHILFSHRVLFFTFLLFLYMNTLFPLTGNESRYSLYMFPYFYIWAGYGIFSLYHKISSFRL